MRRTCSGWLLLGVGLVVLSGCTTTVEPPDSSRPESVRGELRDLIVSDSPHTVLPRVSALRDDALFLESELDEFSQTAISRMHQALEQALSDDAFDEAVVWYKSLVAAGARDEDADFLSQLRLGEAQMLIDRGNDAAALAVLLQSPSVASLPREAVEQALATAVRLNNRAVARQLSRVLYDGDATPPPDIAEFLESRDEPSQMLDGVVTVFVNKGLRLEGGVGIPDRVIGSGFFIDRRGYIVTNYHVIESEVDPEYEGYSRLYVRLRDDPNTLVPARVVGFSPLFDVALLKVEVDAPFVFGFSDARELQPGDRILAIGSPGGLENSIASGVISATGRRFLQMGETMQIDVPVNPGNSGGPLIDESGQLVGVVFAGIEQFEGVNFAIPAYWINRFLRELYEDGAVNHPWMGMAVEPLRDGLEVSYVALGSPAAHAGIKQGDVVRTIDGLSVSTAPQAHDLLLQRGTNVLVRIGYERDGTPREAFVVLEERPRRPVVQALSDDLRDRLYPVLFGMSVERSGQDFFRQVFTVDRVYRGTTADEIGISEGDRFTELGFDYEPSLQVVLLQMFIQKRTDGFMRTNLQLPAFVERDNFI